MKILLTAFFGRQKIEMNSGTILWGGSVCASEKVRV
jgi:hypothetical protein